MAYILEIKRVAGGVLQSVDTVPKNFTGRNAIHQFLAQTPDNVRVVMDGVAPGASETQIRHLLDYAQAIALGANTSSVETAIDAII